MHFKMIKQGSTPILKPFITFSLTTYSITGAGQLKL